MSKFSKELRERRDHLGLTQRDAAERLGMSLRSYCALELGSRKADTVEEAGITSIFWQNGLGSTATAKVTTL